MHHRLFDCHYFIDQVQLHVLLRVTCIYVCKGTHQSPGYPWERNPARTCILSHAEYVVGMLLPELHSAHLEG